MSSDYKLAIAIGGKLDASLAASVKSAQGMLDQLNGGKGGGAIQKALSGAGKAIAGVAKASAASLSASFVAMGATAKEGIGKWEEYQAAFADTAATAGIAKGTEAWTELDEAIMHVGNTTNKTAVEVAEAAKYMFLAGWDKDEVEAGLEPMVKLSSALNEELGRTSDLVTDSMGAANIGIDEMSNYLDMIAKADSAANYTGTDMMEALLGSAGTARNVGVAITDLATAAGILADNGTKGAQGGTALNAMLTNMYTATKNGGLTAIRNIGVDAYDAAGNARPLFDVLTDLNTAMDSLSAEERTQSLYKIFGKSWESQGRYLLDSVKTLQDGTTAYQDLNKELTNAYNGVNDMGDAVGVLQDRYGAMTDTFKGDKELLSSAKDTFLITVGKSLNDQLRAITQETTKIMQELTESFNQDGWTGIAETVGNKLGELSDVFGSKGAEIIAAATDFSTTLVRTIGNNSTEIGAAAAKIVTELGNSFLTYTDDFVEAAGNLIKGLCDGLIQEGTADKWGDALGEMVKNIGSWFSENGASLGETAGTLITQLATQLGEHSGEIIVGGIEIIAGLAEGILKGLPILIEQLPGIVGKIAKALVTEGVPALVAAGKDLAGAIWEGLKSITDTQEPVFQSFDESVNPAILQAYQGNLEAVNAEMLSIADARNWEGLNSFTRELLSGTTSLEEYQAAMAELDTDSLDFDEMSTGLSDFVSLMETAFSNLGIGLEEAAAGSETFGPAIEEAGAAAEEASVSIESMDAQYEELIASVEGVQAAGEGMQEALTIDPSTMDADALSAVLESIDAGNIGQLTAEFDSAMTTITTSANNASTSVQTSVVTMMTVVGANFAQMVVNAATTATSIYNSFASIDLGDVASNMMAGLVEGIRAGGEQAVAEAESIASRIAEVMNIKLDIGSPSRVMERIGIFTGQGLAVGMEKSARDVYSASSNLAGVTVQGTNDSMSSSLREFGSIPAAQPVQQGSTGGNIVFSPQITITGNASESDVRNALAWGVEQFRQMYHQMQQEDRRAAFV